jgi:predicted MFS family arabinose efflux permease
MAFASSVPEVIALRTVCAIGYAVATVSCQVYMMQTAKNEAETTRGLSTFVAAITAASLCGAPIGAVVAEVLGLHTAMLFASGMAGLSWFFFQGLKMPSAGDNPQPTSNSSKFKDFAELLKNRRVLTILLCDIAAGKLMLGGLVFYVTPILLISFQFSQTSIGQFFMLYYLPLIFGNMLIARINPGPHLKIRIMVAGALLTGTGALLLYWFNSAAALAIAIMCIGFGQSMVLTMSTSVIMNITRVELPHISTPNTLALARAFERVGGVLGAAMVAIFSLSFDYREAAVGLGITVLVLCLGNLGLALRSTDNKHASLTK